MRPPLGGGSVMWLFSPPSQDRVKGSGKGGEKRVELRGVSQKSTISTGTRRGGSGAELRVSPACSHPAEFLGWSRLRSQAHRHVRAISSTELTSHAQEKIAPTRCHLLAVVTSKQQSTGESFSTVVSTETEHASSSGRPAQFAIAFFKLGVWRSPVGGSRVLDHLGAQRAFSRHAW